jgi:hypothetical protein
MPEEQFPHAVRKRRERVRDDNAGGASDLARGALVAGVVVEVLRLSSSDSLQDDNSWEKGKGLRAKRRAF